MFVSNAADEDIRLNGCPTERDTRMPNILLEQVKDQPKASRIICQKWEAKE